MITQIPFTYEAYKSRSVNVDAQRIVNLYPERDEGGGGKTVLALYGTPGLTLDCNIGLDAVRGMYATPDERRFAGANSNFYEIVDSVPVLLGQLKTLVGPLFFADNGVPTEAGFGQLAVSDGENLFIFSLVDSSWTPVPFYSDDSTPLIIETLTFQDQYFIGNVPGTRKYVRSKIGDGTSFDVLDFEVKEGESDQIVAVKSNGQDNWIFGKDSYEVHYDAGQLNTVFTRRLGTLAGIGCAAKGSVALLKDTMFWLGDGKNGRGIVWMSNGYSAQRVSTHAIEYFLGNEPRLEDAQAWVYERYGHHFYILNLQIANKTFAYDMITDDWHERAYLDPQTGFLQRHRAVNSCFANGIVYVGDYANGNIYILDENNYTDNGDAQKAIAALPHVAKDDKYISLNSLQLMAEMGVGLPNGSQPAISLRLSRDYGHTFGNPRTTSLGAQGQYAARAIWRSCGIARDFVPEVSITDPVKRVFIGMQADIEVAAL